MSNETMLNKAERYICHRRKLGAKFIEEASLVKSFAEYADTNANNQPITIKHAFQWATLPSASKAQHARRLGVVRGFSAYLAIEEPQTQLIPRNMIKSKILRGNPYIFSHEEILRFLAFKGDDAFTPWDRTNLVTIIGLVYCTGLRTGEAMSLQRSHVDLDKRIITVIDSKRLPMRLVPIDTSVSEKLREYDQYRQETFQHSKSNDFFVSATGGNLDASVVRALWKVLCRQENIQNRRQVHPRLFDLRHTFACNYLLQSYEENRDIDVAVHVLSVYLGHSTVKQTYWYLSAVPELLKFCSDRFEQHSEYCRKREQK